MESNEQTESPLDKEQKEEKEREGELRINIQFHDVPYVDQQKIALFIQDKLKSISRRKRKQRERVESLDDIVPKEPYQLAIYPDFMLDTQPNPTVAVDSEFATGFDIFNDRMVYERSYDAYPTLNNSEQSLESTTRRQLVGSIYKCFNCGRPDHDLRQCKLRLDRYTVQKNRELFFTYKDGGNRQSQQKQQQLARYYEDEKDKSKNIEKSNDRDEITLSSTAMSNLDKRDNGVSITDIDTNETREELISTPFDENKVHNTNVEYLYGNELVETVETKLWKNKLGSTRDKLKEHKTKFMSNKARTPFIDPTDIRDSLLYESEEESIASPEGYKRHEYQSRNRYDYSPRDGYRHEKGRRDFSPNSTRYNDRNRREDYDYKYSEHRERRRRRERSSSYDVEDRARSSRKRRRERSSSYESDNALGSNRKKHRHNSYHHERSRH